MCLLLRISQICDAAQLRGYISFPGRYLAFLRRPKELTFRVPAPASSFQEFLYYYDCLLSVFSDKSIASLYFCPYSFISDCQVESLSAFLRYSSPDGCSSSASIISSSVCWFSGALIGIGTRTLKNGYWRHSDAVGRLAGSYQSMSQMSWMASSLAFCIIMFKFCGRCQGNLYPSC